MVISDAAFEELQQQILLWKQGTTTLIEVNKLYINSLIRISSGKSKDPVADARAALSGAVMIAVD